MGVDPRRLDRPAGAGAGAHRHLGPGRGDLRGGVAAGLQPDVAHCAGLVGAIAERVEPDGAVRADYDEAYGSYRRLFESLRPMFGDHGAEQVP